MREPQTNETINQKRIADFMARLDKLDAGGKGRLKRCAGKSLSEARSAIGLFYGLLPYPTPPPAHEPAYWLVSTLFPLADSGGKGNFGAALRQARTTDNEKGLNRRLEALLDADDAQLAYRLSQAVRFLRSSRVKLNWAGLLYDLLHWKNSTRFVQKAWAKSYFALSSQTVNQLIQAEVEKHEEQETE